MKQLKDKQRAMLAYVHNNEDLCDMIAEAHGWGKGEHVSDFIMERIAQNGYFELPSDHTTCLNEIRQEYLNYIDSIKNL
jgi:hypothetical protein